eukprot:7401314-Pyramimonas_sp.AAC.1
MRGRCVDICASCRHRGGVRGSPDRRPKEVFRGRERGAVRQASQDGVRRRGGIGYAEVGDQNPGEAF